MRKIFALLVIMASFNGLAHKFYITIADMEYNEEKARIEVSLKMTAHDFEWILEQKFKQKFVIEEVNDSSKVGEYMQAYLGQNFQLFSENKKADFNYLGKEVTDREDLYFYFTFTSLSNPAHINIISNLLFSISDLQQNIIHYKYKTETKSVTLVPSQNEAELKFQ